MGHLASWEVILLAPVTCRSPLLSFPSPQTPPGHIGSPGRERLIPILRRVVDRRRQRRAIRHARNAQRCRVGAYRRVRVHIVRRWNQTRHVDAREVAERRCVLSRHVAIDNDRIRRIRRNEKSMHVHPVRRPVTHDQLQRRRPALICWITVDVERDLPIDVDRHPVVERIVLVNKERVLADRRRTASKSNPQLRSRSIAG